jgi:hypothetical protein
VVFNDGPRKRVRKTFPKELEKFIEEMGGKEVLRQSREQFEKDHAFLDKNLQEWRKLYPDHWVAVFKEELIAVADDYFKLLQITKKRDIQSPFTKVVSLLSTKKIEWILPRQQEVLEAVC